jgi:hypothetical protein
LLRGTSHAGKPLAIAASPFLDFLCRAGNASKLNVVLPSNTVQRCGGVQSIRFYHDSGASETTHTFSSIVRIHSLVVHGPYVEKGRIDLNVVLQTCHADFLVAPPVIARRAIPVPTAAILESIREVIVASRCTSADLTYTLFLARCLYKIAAKAIETT